MASDGSREGERMSFIPTEESTDRGRQRGMQRGRSTTSRSYKQPPPAPQRKGWDRVFHSIQSGTLQLVGLKPSKEEELHWDAVKESIRTTKIQSQQRAGGSIGPPPRVVGRGGSVHEAPVSHISHYPYSSFQPPSLSHRRTASEGEERAGVPLSLRTISESGTLRMSSLADKGTGRNQAVRTELRPDLWKVAYKGVRKLVKQEKKKAVVVEDKPRSFMGLDEEDEGEDEVDLAPPLSSLAPIPEYDDEDFFGADVIPTRGEDFTDAAVARYMPSLPTVPEKPPLRPEEEVVPKPLPPKPEAVKRRRIGLPSIIKDPLFAGYDRGYGGLGLPTLLLRFKYKECPSHVQRELDNALLHKRPYFTYWLIVVHIIIMIISLAVYGFAPYGWTLQEERELVQQSNLALDTVERNIVPSVWGGPPQQALVLLGALYGPCMRRDRQLFDAIEDDHNRERDESGCCVRRDDSGCVQVQSFVDCPPRFAEFVFNYSSVDVRGVCGTSPLTCLDPDPQLFPGAWERQDILTWPICKEARVDNSSSHLMCELTGRPCCVGIQALCLITTRDHCDFLEGRFHQEAFLCSQVDCLNDTCGLLPFREFNEPDQVYRLWIALFLHAGLIHLFFSVIFSFFILRHVEKRLGWFRTCVIYVFSGIGGNLVSAYFVPYNPQVGPAGSILGIVAYMFVFLIFEWRLLIRPWVELVKLAFVVLALLLIGLLPFIDNFAHIGGFVFGFFLSGILVPYKPVRDVLEKFDGDNIPESNMPVVEEVDIPDRETKDAFWWIKVALVVIGIPVVLLLFILFFLLFYVVQDTYDEFSYVNCIPFTDTICLDLQGNIRDRDSFII